MLRDVLDQAECPLIEGFIINVNGFRRSKPRCLKGVQKGEHLELQTPVFKGTPNERL